jgi:hypothetical protein
MNHFSFRLSLSPPPSIVSHSSSVSQIVVTHFHPSRWEFEAAKPYFVPRFIITHSHLSRFEFEVESLIPFLGPSSLILTLLALSLKL